MQEFLNDFMANRQLVGLTSALLIFAVTLLFFVKNWINQFLALFMILVSAVAALVIAKPHLKEPAIIEKIQEEQKATDKIEQIEKNVAENTQEILELKNTIDNLQSELKQDSSNDSTENSDKDTAQ